MLPDRDVRRKRPPALSFLLRMETLRKALRVLSLLALDFAGVCAALFTALMLKAVLRAAMTSARRCTSRPSRPATSSPSPTC